MIHRTLHDPTVNDQRLFKLVYSHYERTAYQPLVRLHESKPEYGLGKLIKQATKVQSALENLYELVDEVNMLASTLKNELSKAKCRLPSKTSGVSGAATTSKSVSSAPGQELLTAATFTRSEKDMIDSPHPMLIKSFSAAEEALARRGHARAATYSDTGYTTNSYDGELAQPTPKSTLRVDKRSKGTSLPRIFTGSFSELEDDIRRLQLDKVKTPEDQSSLNGEDYVKVRDFGATPQISPCPTPTLQRREAMVSRETEIQDRVINGEVIATRRPSTKGRAQTIDETSSGGLDAWLQQDSPKCGRSKVPGTPAGAVQRGSARHRENTL